VADLITAAGADRLLTMDLHAAQIQGYFNIPVDHLIGSPILADYFIEKDVQDLVVVSPDLGSVTRARAFANRLNCGIAIIDKSRPEPNVSEVMHIIGNVEGKNVILIDDMIDTAGTITNGAEALKDIGARDIYACCTHAVFSGPAIDRIKKSSLKEVVVTDTIKLADDMRLGNIRELSVASTFAEAIRRIFNDESVSTLFD
jgi:ribose-phosphate pyrophosphokinase